MALASCLSSIVAGSHSGIGSVVTPPSVFRGWAPESSRSMFRKTENQKKEDACAKKNENRSLAKKTNQNGNGRAQDEDGGYAGKIILSKKYDFRGLIPITDVPVFPT
ncbi:hypothetical protein F4680DRAFT_443057 [Xylaria scruposa]|nr:hypothetical protein F4680DRAFT_443057 [Xylaria scruposa]